MNWKKIPVFEFVHVEFDTIPVAYFKESQKQEFFTAIVNHLMREQDWVILDLGNGLFELAIRFKIEIYTGKKK
jgi:hypothetical protein